MSDLYEKLQAAAKLAERAESEGLAEAVTEAVVKNNPELAPLKPIAEPLVRRALSGARRFWAWLWG